LKNVKSILIYAAVIVFIGVMMFLSIQDEGGRKPVVLTEGMPAPGVRLTDLSGKDWDLSGLRGSVVIVNFWATWCPPCKEEMPSLSRLYEKYKERDDFEVLAVLYNDTTESAREFVEKGGFGFPVLIDPLNHTARDYGLTGVPETYIIDKRGVLAKKFIGPVQFDTPDSHAFMDRLLAAPAE
jgi:peroxiredoxin